MQWMMKFRLLSVLWCLGFICLLPACSNINLQSKFKPASDVNLQPFSDQVNYMVTGLDYAFEFRRSLYLKAYASRKNEDVQQLLLLEQELTKLLRSISNYSIKLVELSSSGLPDNEKNLKLAKFIDVSRKQAISRTNIKLHLSEDEVSSTIREIKSKDNYLDGLLAAQPLIDESAQYGARILDELKRRERMVEKYLTTAIEQQHKPFLQFNINVREQQKAVVKAIQLFNDYEKGDEAALAKLKMTGFFMGKEITQYKKLNTKQKKRLEQHLLGRMAVFEDLTTKLESDYNRYIRAYKELDRLIEEHDNELRKVGIVITAWSRAHKRMSEGRTVPAEWFDLKDVPKLILKSVL